MSVFQKVRGTTSDNFTIGVGKVGDKYLEADTGDALVPFIRYNDTAKRWEISNDGTTIYDSFVDWLLENEPPRPTNDYAVTRVSGQVTQEAWRRTADATLIKTIDYTYVSGKVSVEDRKTYADDGVTVIGELTITYTYLGSLVVSATGVRVV
jgi:hypothetical protein